MNRRLVRIYKDPKGNGDYVNKTKAFLQKAQMGAETQSAPDVNKYLQYIYEQLSNDTTPEDIFAELISAGLNQDIAYKMLNSVVAQMVDAGELNPDNPVTKKDREEETQLQEEQQQAQEQQQVQEEVDPATDYFNSYADEPEYSQPELEFQEGGEIIDYDDGNGAAMFNQYTTDNNLNNTDESDMQDSENADFDNNSSDVSKYGFLNEESQYPGLNDYYESFTPLSWEPVDTSIYRKGGSKKSFVKNVLKRLQEGGQEQTLGVGQGNKFDTFTDDVSKKKQDFINTIKDKANKARLNETYDKMMKSNDPSLIQSAQTLSQNRNQSQQEEGQFFQTGGYVGEGQPDMFMYGGTELPFFEGDFLPEAQEGTEVRKAKINYVPNPVLPANQGTGLFGIGKRRTYSNMPYNTVTKEVYKDSLEGLTPYARTVHKRGILGRPKQWTDYYSKTQPLTPGQEIKAAYEKQIGDTKNKNLKYGMTEEEWNKLSGREKRREKKWARMAEKDAAFNKGVSQYIDEDVERQQQLDKNNKMLMSMSKNLGMDTPEFWQKNNKVYGQDYNIALPDSMYGDIFGTDYTFPYVSSDYVNKENNQELIGKELEDYIQEYGSLMRYQIQGAVKSPTNNLSGASDPTATSPNLINMLKPQENSNTFMGSSSSFMNQNVPVNKEAGKEKSIVMDPEQIKGNKITSESFNDDTIAQDFKTARDFDGEAFNRGINATGNWFANMMNKRDAARQEREMYENNFTADSIYGASSNKDRGDYVAYGQQTGMFRPDQTGNDTMGRFAYGQMGGYMQDGGYTEGDEVDMTEEELAEFIANGGEVEYLES